MLADKRVRFKVFEGKGCELRILHIVKWTFKYKGHIPTMITRQILR